MHNSRNLTLYSVPSRHVMSCHVMFFPLHFFLLQIVTRLRKAGSSSLTSGTKSDSESERGSESDEKLSVFSGHDTVIAPVLAALGLYEGELCVWPPYASRIVFELWQKKGRSKDLDGAGSGSDHSLSVRVIFNGQDLTHRIPACKAERDAAVGPGSLLRPTKQTGAGTGAAAGMCSLQALEEQVKSMLGHHPSLKAAC